LELNIQVPLNLHLVALQLAVPAKRHTFVALRQLVRTAVWASIYCLNIHLVSPLEACALNLGLVHLVSPRCVQ